MKKNLVLLFSLVMFCAQSFAQQDTLVKLGRIDISDQGVISLQLKNNSGKVAQKVTFELTDAKGKVFAKLTQNEYRPNQSVQLETPLKGKSIYALVNAGQPIVRVKGTGLNTKVQLPETIALLAVAKGAMNESNEEVAKLGEKLAATVFVYNSEFPRVHNAPINLVAYPGTTIVKEPFTAQTQKALQALTSGTTDQQIAALKEAITAIVGDAKDLSNKSIYLIGYAHMDLYWLWNHMESVKMIQDNMRQAVAFMKEKPNYVYSQSQAAIYAEVEKSDPETFEEIKRYVKEGRIEPLGGEWSEGDNNLSGGEAVARSFLLGQRYFKSRFDKMAKVGWLPDNFGHTAQFPQMLQLAEIENFYFHRCKPNNNTMKGNFVWEGKDGSKVLCYANNSYVTTLTPDVLRDFDPKRLLPENQDRLFHVLGVGDHGGGPTRRDIVASELMPKVDRFPSVKFTTAEKFFNDARKDIAKYPTHKGELQFVFEGCYTSVADVKEGHRNSEAYLFESEVMNTLKNLFMPGGYPEKELKWAWERLTFNQFHDIIPGSSIHEANKDAISYYNMIQRTARETKEKAFRSMIDYVDLKKDKGQPIVAFNYQPYKGKVLVEAEVFSHEEPATARGAAWSQYYREPYVRPMDQGQGNYPTAVVTDDSGKIYPAQITWYKFFPPGYRSKVQFVVDEMPAGGYKAFYVDLTQPGEPQEPISYKDNTFETDFFTIRIDDKSGAIISLKDKRTGKEYAKGEMNTLRVYQEDKKGSMKAWSIHETGVEENMRVEKVNVTELGPVRACVEVLKKWGNSHVIERTYIYKSYPRIDYNLEVHWLEWGSPEKDSPMLRALFPLNMSNVKFANNVQFGVEDRPTNGQEVPALRWVDVSDGKDGIALLNKTKFGHSYRGDTLRLTLMRSSAEPDLYPNLGRFVIDYSLYPHTGDWTNGVWFQGDLFNNPVYAAEPASLSNGTRGGAPAENSLYEISTPDVVMTGFKKAEDHDGMVMRVVETVGKAQEVTIRLPKAISTVDRLNLIEHELVGAESPRINGDKLTFKIKPYEIVTLGCRF